MEKKFSVSLIGVSYICDSCETGEMNPTGKMKMHEFHATFVHKCNNCGNIIELKEKYPLIRYEHI